VADIDFNGTYSQAGECDCCDSCETCLTNCQSCGMPMTGPGDFGGGNPENIYCVHCTHPDGSLKTYEEALEGMTTFMMQMQHLDRETAGKTAREYMSKMPAWSGH
jgi:hypothetical protein